MTHAEFENYSGLAISEIDFQNIILPLDERMHFDADELKEIAALWDSLLFRSIAEDYAREIRKNEALRDKLERLAIIALERGDHYNDSQLTQKAKDILGIRKVLEVKIREDWPLEDDEKDLILKNLSI